MIELTEYEKEYWKDRASEPLRFEPYPDDVCDEIERTHAFLTEEQAIEAIKKSQDLI